VRDQLKRQRVRERAQRNQEKALLRPQKRPYYCNTVLLQTLRAPYYWDEHPDPEQEEEEECSYCSIMNTYGTNSWGCRS
jgi:hypothetical protein